MSGLEIPAFIVGLSGLTAIFDKACSVWYVISNAKQYGDDIANFMNKLELEYFRFQTWWTALESLAADRQNTRLTSTTTPLTTRLEERLANPIKTAASRILENLDTIEALFARQGILDVLNQTKPTSRSTPNSGANGPASSGIDSVRSRQRLLAKDLLKSIPWLTRVKHDATPWKESDKKRFNDILFDIRYWNDSLYAFIPQSIRESILEQGIAGYILQTHDHAQSIAAADTGATDMRPTVAQYAKLMLLRERLKTVSSQIGGQTAQETVDEMRKKQESFESLKSSYDGKHAFGLFAYKELQTALGQKVLIEWYPYPPPELGLSIWNLAQQRIARLSRTLQAQNKPTTLHALDCIGFVENDGGHCFGLVSELPEWASMTVEPVTLFQILTKQVQLPVKPSLKTRFELAANLASSLYTFMLVRWHHKRFQSNSVYFLYERSSTASPDMSKPFVGGFVVSRPNESNELTFPGRRTKESEMYLHPELRVTPPRKSPAFRTSYEIYSFGLLLAEIGFWNSLSVLVLRGRKGEEVSAQDVKKRIIQTCRTDLACWMGDRYRDVTLRCLQVESLEDGGIGEDLNDFYWQVVLELIKCVPEF